MTRPELEELLWRESDGELTPRERRRLERLLARDPESAGLRRQIEATGEMLSELEPVAPPPELRRRLADALAEEPAHRAPRARRGWLALASDWLPKGRPARRFAYAAATVVLVLGVAAVWRLGGLGSDGLLPGDFTGTVNVPRGGAEEAGVVLFEDQELRVVLGARDRSTALVTVDSATAEMIWIEVSQAPEDDPPGGGPGSSAAPAPADAVRHRGPGRVRIEVGIDAAAGGPLRVRLRTADRVWLDRDVPLEEIPGLS